MNLTREEREKLKEQAKRMSEDLWYEGALRGYEVSFDKLKDTDLGLYEKLKLESDTLVDEYFNHCLKKAINGKIKTRKDIEDALRELNLPWGLPSSNVIWWIENKLKKEGVI